MNRNTLRRKFLITTGVLAASFAANAQQSGKVYRIGLLTPGSKQLRPSERSVWSIIHDGLRELGYVDGRNIVAEQRFADGSVDRLNEYAVEFVRLKVDVIVTIATPAAQAAQKATSTIPIIFVAVVDPMGSGLVTSLARPDGNITGLITLAAELSGKRLQLLMEVVPKLSRVAILANPANASNGLQLRDVEDAARILKVQTQRLEVRMADDIEKRFQAAVQRRAGALMVLDDPLLFTQRTRIAALAHKHRLPTMCGFREIAEAGALIAYGLNPLSWTGNCLHLIRL
jgi:putative ABC transport system substrate-binding protein